MYFFSLIESPSLIFCVFDWYLFLTVLKSPNRTIWTRLLLEL